MLVARQAVFSAILLNISGTPSAAATALDGHPMASRGDVGRALGVAIIASFVGDYLASASIHRTCARGNCFQFKSPDLFSLVFGLTIICSFAAKL